MRKQQSPIPQKLSPRASSCQYSSEDSTCRGNCTLIETIHGEVKLITRSNDSLEALRFPNLKDCLEYIDRSGLQINIIHSGKRRETERDHLHQ
jgi:hypothetical protein